LDQFDFAVLILAPDDVTIDQLSPSTRDNVLFEFGLFMGRLGRDRVFVVYDDSIELKKPSDLAGVMLAPMMEALLLALPRLPSE
jgi:predicted nucleotide-binding protein